MNYLMCTTSVLLSSISSHVRVFAKNIFWERRKIMILNQFLMMVCNGIIHQCERNPGGLQHELDRSWHWQDGWVSQLVWIYLVLSLQIQFSRKWLQFSALQIQQREEDNLQAVGHDSVLGKMCRKRAGRIVNYLSTMFKLIFQLSASFLFYCFCMF